VNLFFIYTAPVHGAGLQTRDLPTPAFLMPIPKQ